VTYDDLPDGPLPLRPEDDEIWQLSHGLIKATHVWESGRLVCMYCGLSMKQIVEKRIALCREAPKEATDEQRP
jgi:hypothetical protein